MNVKPISISLGLSELCDLDLDALARLCDAYHAAAPVWSEVHRATLDERLRRIRAMRTRVNKPGGVNGLAPIVLTIPPGTKGRTIEDCFNSIRAAYLAIEPATHEATSGGCVARALTVVLIRLARGYRAAALRFADAEAIKRVAVARAAPMN